MLNVYLKRAGHVTGPRLKNTSHSAMEVIKKYLLGIPQFKGGEQYLYLGNAVHEVFLENKYDGTYQRLTPEEKKQVDAMVRKLNSHPVVKALMKDSIREEKFIVVIEGVEVAVILDSKQKTLGRGFDLKTTNATSQQQFAAKAKSLGYPRQTITYKKAAGLKDFYIVAIQKEAPYYIHILNTADWKDDNKYAEQEFKFLLYFYKHYGKIEDESTKQVTTKININMSQGKEALALIKAAASEHKEAKKILATNTKHAEKLRQNVIKLVGKFPKKERELYVEKLDAVIAGL